MNADKVGRTMKNSPHCPYCKGLEIDNCYCVVRKPLIIPQQHDSHVALYDAKFVYEKYKEAKETGNKTLQYVIKSGLNIYMLPFAELRKVLLTTNLIN